MSTGKHQISQADKSQNESDHCQRNRQPRQRVEELHHAMNAEEQVGLRLLQLHFVALVDLLVEGLGDNGHVWDC